MNRRDWLRVSTVGAVGFSMSGWLRALAKETAGTTPKKSCILLWMNGGPSQMDTFDLKPGHPHGGAAQEIAHPGARHQNPQHPAQGARPKKQPPRPPRRVDAG